MTTRQLRRPRAETTSRPPAEGVRRRGEATRTLRSRTPSSAAHPLEGVRRRPRGAPAGRSPQPKGRPQPKRRPQPKTRRRKGVKGPLRIPLARVPQRLHLVLISLAIALSLCAGRLLQLQGFDSSAYAAVSAEALTRTLPLLPSRGDITDRNGVVLAATEPAVAVTADPSLTRLRAGEFAAVLTKYLELPPAKLLPLLTKPNTRFVYLKHKVPSLTYSRLATELSDKDLYGVFRESDPIRTYPGGKVAGGLVGFVSNTGAGQAGIEMALNTQLAGVEGKEVYESSPNGGKIPLGTSSVTPAVNGLNYQLTIDSELQWLAERRIAAQVRRTHADYGFAITMNVKTGEVLALAQAPTVNSAKPAGSKDVDRGVRAVSDPYEPGSVQKVLTSAALVDAGLVDAETRLRIPNRLPSGSGTIKDHFEHDVLSYNMRGVISASSNIGMVMLARQLPKQRLVAYLKRFGLGAKTGIELPVESAGIVPGTDLQDLTRDQIAFGQALAVTGVQEVAAISGIINDGIYHPPTLVKSARTSGGAAAPLPKKTARRVVSPHTSDVVRDLMRSVIDSPNGQRNLSLPGYETGGKTGTAQRADPKCHCYRGYVTSFVGFAPYDDPHIITYVVLNNPKKKGDTGTQVAAPVYRDIMRYALPRYSVPPNGHQPPPKPITW